ncbi:hypothetical protein [Rathayibacter soli]|nr:hypothetical protein [Glaciibacter superstes]
MRVVKDCWPYADEQGEYGQKFNNLAKFVARDTAAIIREPKEHSSKDI